MRHHHHLIGHHEHLLRDVTLLRALVAHRVRSGAAGISTHHGLTGMAAKVWLHMSRYWRRVHLHLLLTQMTVRTVRWLLNHHVASHGATRSKLSSARERTHRHRWAHTGGRHAVWVSWHLRSLAVEHHSLLSQSGRRLHGRGCRREVHSLVVHVVAPGVRLTPIEMRLLVIVRSSVLKMERKLVLMWESTVLWEMLRSSGRLHCLWEEIDKGLLRVLFRTLPYRRRPVALRNTAVARVLALFGLIVLTLLQ